MQHTYSVLIIQVLILRCTAVALGSSEFCRGFNRFPLNGGYKGCGPCLGGYSQDKDGYCTLLPNQCAPNLRCEEANRMACDSNTQGKCGDCSDGYIDMEGICVTEREVRDLIGRIETILNEDGFDQPQSINDESTQSQAGKETVSQSQPNSEEIGQSHYSESAPKTSQDNSKSPEAKSIPSDGFVDKKAQASINGINIESTNQQPQSDPNTEASSTKEEIDIPASTPDSKLQEEKRIPLAAAKVASQIGDGAQQTLITQEGTAGFSQLVFFVVVLGVSLLCVTSLVIAGVCWYRLRKQQKAMEAVEYAGYGGDYAKKTSISRSESGDRKLAQSAQMYHYQHHKQQMIALEKSLSDKLDDSEHEEEPEENEDGNYTVYECPGLAPTGEMEVQNPLFQAPNNNKQGSQMGSPGSDRSVTSNQ